MRNLGDKLILWGLLMLLAAGLWWQAAQGNEGCADGATLSAIFDTKNRIWASSSTLMEDRRTTFSAPYDLVEMPANYTKEITITSGSLSRTYKVLPDCRLMEVEAGD